MGCSDDWRQTNNRLEAGAQVDQDDDQGEEVDVVEVENRRLLHQSFLMLLLVMMILLLI